jgi:probable HAF family extracellular repeat protein
LAAEYHVQCQDCDIPPAVNTFNLVYAINNHGVIAGQARDTAAVLYNHGVRTALGTLGGPSSIAWDVNDSLVAVGEATLPDGSTRAFSWKNGVMTNLGVLYPGDAFSIANGINKRGQVVGTSTTPGGTLGPTITHCFVASYVYSQGPLENLGLPPNAPVNGQCAQPSINRRGHVAMTIADETFANRYGYILRDGQWTALGSLDTEFPNSFAEGMNDLDQVVGESSSMAFLWTNGVMKDLGFLSGDGSGGAGAFGINSKSHVVGVSSIAGVVKDHVFYSTAAFIYKKHKMVDLNGLLDFSSRHWYLERAIDIDDDESIAAIGYLNGVAHAVLLTPGRCGPLEDLLGLC